MRTQSQVVRSCTIAIPLIHLAIFGSLIFSRDFTTGEALWQELFPTWNNLLRDGLSFSVILALILLGALTLPPLASWTASRYPMRMMSLVSLWASLLLTLVAWFLFMLWLLNLPSQIPNRFLSVFSLAILSLGFALSFTLCLVLAICLPRIHAHEQAALAVNRPERLASAQDERAERFHVSEREARPEHVGMGRYLPSLAFPGLLCHLLIFLSLSSPYTETYDPYQGGVTFRTTGWQMIGGGCQAIILLPALIPPVFVYMSCVLLFPLKSERKDALLGKCFSLNCLLNTVGFAFSIGVLGLSQFGDFNKETHKMDAASGIPLAAFFLSLICSSVLLGHFLRRTRAKVR